MARRCCPWAARPSTFSDSTGKTQGIRFSSAPPSRASSNDTARPDAGGGALSAGAPAPPPAEPPAEPPAGGQAPLTCTVSCTPAGGAAAGPAPEDAPAWASTASNRSGLWLRCADSLTRATQAPSTHRASCAAALSITPGNSGNRRSVRPAQSAGSPETRSCSASGSTCACASAPGRTCGCAARAASKSAPCAAVAACAGSLSANSPDSGMHTSLHTSHSACSRTSSACPAKPAGTCTGTGSSSVPS